MKFERSKSLILLLWLLANTLIWPVVWFVGSLSALSIYRFLSTKFYHDASTEIWYVQPVNWQMHLSAIFALMIAGVIVGLGIGYIQWLVLRRVWPISVQWIGVSALGCVAAMPISYGIVEILRSQLSINLTFLTIAPFIGGLASGIGEWLILKRHTLRSIGWLVANTVGWGVSGMLGRPFLLFMGLLSGLMTGVILVLLSKNSIEAG